MKPFFTTLVCFAFTALATAGVVEQRYDNGKIKSRYTTGPTGLHTGPYSLYYPDGKVEESGTYHDGKLIGAFEKSYPTGRPMQKATYTDGLLDGTVTDYDAAGKPTKSATYKAGVLNGIYREYADGSAVVERGYVGGLLCYPRSQSQIRQALAAIHRANILTTQPTTPVPSHNGSNDSEPDREEAVRVLKAYRYLSFVPQEELCLDPVQNAYTEGATLLLAKLGHLEHTPKNPGLPEADYKFGYQGTSHSNLYQGPPGSAFSVSAYIHEDGVLGHRRWCLNPPMAKTGFAYSNGFSAMWAFDQSGRHFPDWDFVSFPGRGYIPSSYFNATDTWHVSLNPSKYSGPVKGKVKVTITPARVALDKAMIVTAGTPLRLSRLDSDNAGYGIPNCIMFKPVGLSTAQNRLYQIEITGIIKPSGEPTSVKFVVEFFKL